MNTERKKFVREYVEARGGVEELSDDEKKALTEMATKDADSED